MTQSTSEILLTNQPVIAVKKVQALTQQTQQRELPYQNQQGLTKSTKPKREKIAHLFQQESEIPPPKPRGDHQSQWTMYEDLKKYLHEIIVHRSIDDKGMVVLHSGLNYDDTFWPKNDIVKNTRMALHAFSYLAELNVKFPKKIIEDINIILNSHANKNIVEYALLTLAFLIINKQIVNFSDYITPIERGIHHLMSLHTQSNPLFYPALLMGLLAKTLMGKPLATNEIDVLRRFCTYMNAEAILQCPSLINTRIQTHGYSDNPMWYYSDDANYYKKQNPLSKGEIQHLIDIVDSGKISDRIAQCHYTNAIRHVILHGHIIPESHYKKLTEFIQTNNHHKTQHYSQLILAHLLQSAEYKGGKTKKELADLARKFGTLGAVWRGYALKAYYHHLNLEKSRNSRLQFNQDWKTIIEHWFNHDDRSENKRMATLILHATDDTVAASKFSIEPDECTSTLALWLDMIERRVKIPCSVLEKIIIIISTQNKYTPRQQELALQIVFAMLEDNTVMERLVGSQTEISDKLQKLFLVSRTLIATPLCTLSIELLSYLCGSPGICDIVCTADLHQLQGCLVGIIAKSPRAAVFISDIFAIMSDENNGNKHSQFFAQLLSGQQGGLLTAMKILESSIKTEAYAN